MSTRHQHFTHIGVTTLDGNALMCVVIVAEKKHDMLVELGIDTTKLEDFKFDLDIEDKSDTDKRLMKLLEKYSGEGKVFPGLPSCWYKGKEIPSYVAFSESGGITPTILTNIFRRLDELKLFDEDRRLGITPFVMLDGHGSRFHLEFLEYINDPKHKWNICLGVPYGTALWQIGDAERLNGIFKLLLTKEKRYLFKSRVVSCLQDLHLTRTDIIPLIRMCWDLSFGNVESIKKAIAECGWGPYNRALLLHPIIRSTMTQTMTQDEKNSDLFPHNKMAHLHNIFFKEDKGGRVTRRHADEDEEDYAKINFEGEATSQNVTSLIMNDRDCQVARERSQKLKEEGKSLKERMENIKKFMTATKLTIDAHHYHLNETVRDHARNKAEEKGDIAITKKRKEEVEYAIKCYKAHCAKLRNPNVDVKTWRSYSDIKTYLDPLKDQQNDGPWPKSRGDIEVLYSQWHGRQRCQLVLNKEQMKQFEDILEAKKIMKAAKAKKKVKQGDTMKKSPN